MKYVHNVVEKNVEELILKKLLLKPECLKLLLPLYITSSRINSQENREKYEIIKKYNNLNNLVTFMSFKYKKYDIGIFKIIHKFLVDPIYLNLKNFEEEEEDDDD